MFILDKQELSSVMPYFLPFRVSPACNSRRTSYRNAMIQWVLRANRA